MGASKLQVLVSDFKNKVGKKEAGKEPVPMCRRKP